MRNAALLGTRLILGSYLAVHGAQKLFGAFGGSGLEKAGAGFERRGPRPGKHMAAAAGITELGGGLLAAALVARMLAAEPAPVTAGDGSRAEPAGKPSPEASAAR